MTYLDQPTSTGRHPRRFGDLHSAALLSRIPVGQSRMGQRAIAVPLNHRAVAMAQVEQAVGYSMLRLWCLMALLALILFSSGRAWGQAAEYIKEPLPDQLKVRANVSTMERAKSEGLTKADLTPQWASYRALEAYYRAYLFGKLKDPAYTAEAGKIMQTMLDDLERSQRAGAPAARLLSEWIVAGASAIAAENYHPAARVNATLLLALVDEKGADLRAGTPPVPARSALGPLGQLYNTATNPDGVRAAALQGIARHVNLGAVTNPQARTTIARWMLELAKSDPPITRSDDAHAYMQRYAIDILSVLANPNIADQTTQTLVSLSTSKEKPSLIAAYAASKMGQLQPAGRAKVDQPSKVLISWAARAAEAIDQELDRIARLDPPVAVRDQPAMPTEQTRTRRTFGGDYSSDYDEGTMMGGPGYEMEGSYDTSYEMDYMDMGGMDGMMTRPVVNPQPVEVIASRRYINHILQQLQVGVTGRPVTGKPNRPGGLLVLATENDQAAFDGWITTISDVVAAINVDTLDNRVKYVDALKEQSIVLKNLAGIEIEPEDMAILPGDAMNDFAPMVGADEPGGPIGGPGPVGPPLAADADQPGRAPMAPRGQAPATAPRGNGQPPAGPQGPLVGPNAGDNLGPGEDFDPNEDFGPDEGFGPGPVPGPADEFGPGVVPGPGEDFGPDPGPGVDEDFDQDENLGGDLVP